MKKKINPYVYWVPRIATIVFIMFTMLFSLDVFEDQKSFWDIVVALFIHNIPAIVLTIVLLISWKIEIVGGIFYILTGLVYLIFFVLQNHVISASIKLVWFASIGLPIMVIGFLFIINWIQKRKLIESKEE